MKATYWKKHRPDGTVEAFVKASTRWHHRDPDHSQQTLALHVRGEQLDVEDVVQHFARLTVGSIFDLPDPTDGPETKRSVPNPNQMSF